ncbi:hypothetical protein NPX13_g10041 [Xylaria arbuscula]|uniref:RPAP1 N-terminal domain-containing protein n=1 Tax=Xylaria arbuscula TaxID=114810 RepID=A0A9W8TGY2_9PEZI|nr:hypothetical protein NPX13_g10041 [Xylaria arbuscula]
MDLFVRDIQEKDIVEAKAPSFPQARPGTSGFPEHKKRNKPSAFKQKRQGISPDSQTPKPTPSSSDQPLTSLGHGSKAQPSSQGFMANERTNIDRENSQKLASMSPQEIEEARQELFSGLDSSILERLLKRANLDQGSNIATFDESHTAPETAPSRSEQTDQTPEIRVEDTSVGTDTSTPPNQSSKDQSSTTDVRSNNKSKPPKPHPSTTTAHQPSPLKNT